jgi:hypothetical protein
MTTLRILVLMLAGLLGAPIAAQAQSADEQLGQLVQKLQSNPSDISLREQIIKVALQFKPAPAIPEDARAHFIKGTTIAKAARNAPEQGLAEKNLKEASRIAPWWGDAYHELAAVQELVNQFADAQTSLRLYILTEPGTKEVRDAQDHIYVLDAKQELASAQTAAPAVQALAQPAAQQARATPFGNSLDGAVFVRQGGGSDGWGTWRGEFRISRGRAILKQTQLTATEQDTRQGRYAGKTWTVLDCQSHDSRHLECTNSINMIGAGQKTEAEISPDGSTITWHSQTYQRR